jgi:hypothetical protein
MAMVPLGSFVFALAFGNGGGAEAQAKGGVGPLAFDDPDSDRDGLSDFMETHKYFTDPKKADSDGDGIPDGDWEERREYAYTVRTLIQVLPPVTPDVLCDDYQDARILESRPDYVELEVIHYPLNTVADAIVADPDWRKHVAARKELKPFLEPGRTSNWTPKMRDEMVAALKADGIDVAKLDDKTLVEKASKWIFAQTKFADGFTTYCSTFEGGKAHVLPGLEGAAERGKNESGLTLDEQWDRELFAAGMWERKVHGSCTSSAIFVDGCLRALGIPTRVVLFMPCVDGSDEREVGWLATKLTNHVVQKTLRKAIEPLKESWANHTFNEVWVAGRWRRLNYSRLGQNILDPSCFGLMTHLTTFADWSDGEMAKSWGLRQNGDEEAKRRDVFGGSNPYSCIALSDRFGAHAKVDNPEPAERTTLTITKLIWWNSPERTVDQRLDDPDTAGHLVAHVAECTPGEGVSQYADFYSGVDKDFLLQADGHEDVPLHAIRSYWVDSSKDIHDFYLRIEPRDVPRMELGVVYRLVARNEKPGFRWAVDDGITLTRDEKSVAKPLAPRAKGEELQLTIDSFCWSDAAETPKFIRESLAGEPRLCCHVESWGDWADIKELTTQGDANFALAAEGGVNLRAQVGGGGITMPRHDSGKDAWVILHFDAESRAKLESGIPYFVQPINRKPGYRWKIKEGVFVPPRS